MKNNKKITLYRDVCATKIEILKGMKQQLVDHLQYEVDDEDALFTDKDGHELSLKLIDELIKEDK